jgi:F-box-like
MTIAHTEHRRLLFEEEHRLAEALSAVRTRLNELTAIAILPTEVLELIFGFCITWLYGHHKPKFRLAWVQVCRRWRSISLNSPHLWHCIDLCNSPLANEFLIRSKSTPISIVSAYPLKSCVDNSCIDNLGSHAERLRAIDVFLFPDSMVELFSSIGSQLPNVTNLSLTVPPMPIAFILDIQMPRVTRLALDYVTVPWDACRNLTHLSLRGLSTDYSPTITQLHSIFESSPNLTFLRLENIVPTLYPNNDISLTHIIPLPHLRKLIITATAPIILALFSRIAFPSTTRVQLACSEFNDVHSFLPRDRSWQTANVGTIRLDQRSVIFLRQGTTPWTEKSSDFLFSITSMSWPGKSVLSGMHLIVGLSNITSLELGIEGLADIPPELLSNFLAETVNLESLHILHNALGDLFRILTPIRNTPVLCPRLKCMTFSMNYPAAVQWWYFNKRWAQPVLALAKGRYEHGIPLVALEFRRCRGVTAQQFEGLVKEIHLLDC